MCRCKSRHIYGHVKIINKIKISKGVSKCKGSQQTVRSLSGKGSQARVLIKTISFQHFFGTVMRCDTAHKICVGAKFLRDRYFVSLCFPKNFGPFWCKISNSVIPAA